jgi:GNAT superfamily N-acetyltransferase/DNA-binding MarR family transcriptional regulator
LTKSTPTVDNVNVAHAIDIEAVREFNRFYTTRMGLTRGRYLGTNHPLAEARVLYELGTGTTATAELKTRLGIDRGQLSRLLTRLEAQGLLEKHTDGRSQTVALTEHGRATYETLNARSAQEIGRILDGLADAPGAIEAMRALKAAIEPDETLLIRGPQPGDLGWLVERHGVLYAREYGWDESFERLVARIAADFDPRQDRAWIAEHNGRRAGAVLCVHEDKTTAKLRTLLVEPHARGLGLGTRLVEEVIRHARKRNYTTLTLWTNDVLHAARRIYERAGFTLEHEAPHHAFGHDLVEQTWSLTLTAWTETR